MEITWDEKLVLATIRVFQDNVRPMAYVRGLSRNTVDGGYVEFRTGYSRRDFKIHVQLFPVFVISLTKEPRLRDIFKKPSPQINLMEEKNKYPEFSHLPEKYANEDELLNILNEYKLLIKKVLEREK